MISSQGEESNFRGRSNQTLLLRHFLPKMDIMNMDLEIISVVLKVSLLEMKGNVPLHLNSPTRHHDYVLISNGRLPFRNPKKDLMLQGDALIVLGPLIRTGAETLGWSLEAQCHKCRCHLFRVFGHFNHYKLVTGQMNSVKALYGLLPQHNRAKNK